METSIESLLNQLEIAYYNANIFYKDPNFSADHKVIKAYYNALAERQAIKNEILSRFISIENELIGLQNFMMRI